MVNLSKKEAEIIDGLVLLVSNKKYYLIDEILEYMSLSCWRKSKSLLIMYTDLTHRIKDKLKKRELFIRSCNKFHPDVKLWQNT